MTLALLKMAQRLISVPKVASLCWWVGGEPGNPVWCPPSLWRGTTQCTDDFKIVANLLFIA